MSKYRHGGPFDRGSADKYYGRNYDPHYYEGPTGLSKRVGRDEMTEEEIAEYREGYNEEMDKKEW